MVCDDGLLREGCRKGVTQETFRKPDSELENDLLSLRNEGNTKQFVTEQFTI